MTTRDGGSRQVVFIGLDGATFDLLDPLIAEGVMPHLGRILSEGARAVLSSTVPPVTAPAWTSLTTGVNPGRHGIFDFRVREGTRLRWVSSQSVRAPRVWDYANAAGRSAGVLNVPVTYPPAQINGYMIPGMLTPADHHDCAFPRGLRHRLEKAVGPYIIYEPIPPQGEWTRGVVQDHLQRLSCMVAQRARALLWLMESQPCSLTFAVFQVLDTLQHSFWKVLDRRDPSATAEPGRSLRPSLLAIYRQVDGILGEIRRRLDADSCLVIASDHGFGPLRHRFLVNMWLAGEGYLRLSWPDLIAEKVVRRVRNRFVSPGASAPLFQRTSRYVPDHRSAIRWKGTRAFSGEAHQQAIYVNVKGREPMGAVEPGAEYQSVRDSIIWRLAHAIDPRSGQSLHARALRREEAYAGPYVSDAPDLGVVVDGYKCQAVTNVSLGGGYLRDERLPLGSHRREGMLAAFGSGVRPDQEMPIAAIEDVTPLLLHLLGLPIPSGLDGEVPAGLVRYDIAGDHRQCYADLTMAAEAHGHARAKAQGAEDIEARLRALGYLD